ncbi:MAG: hypothetical protein GX639_01580 [Fibrobacter sp.]|nr:hypothetical protein [Fibrobacter sp.]
MNKTNIFSDDGHISKWVFFPPAWGGEDYWCHKFSVSEKELLLSHMKSCHQCQEVEIEATLQWVEQRSSCMELIESLQTNQSNGEHSNVVAFDDYPEYILQHILQFTKGRLITFSRDEAGKVIKITGKTDGNVESESVFIYDGATVSVHSYCHNCEDNPLSDHDRITFTDFHIDFSNNRLVVYNSDSTDFYPEDKTINRNHMNHKIFYSASDKVVKILQDNKLWYSAEYNANSNLLKEKHGEIINEFGYDGNNKKFKNSTSDDGTIIDHFIYEYAEGSAIPFRSFKRINNQIQLDQLNTQISSEEFEHVQLELVFDGIARNFYDESGSLVIKVRLPDDPSQSSIHYSIASLKDKGGKFDSIDMVLVDNNAKSIRILKKINEKRIVDQTAFYQKDHITKVYNHKDAQYTAVLGSFFSSLKWSDIIERDDNIL